MLLPVACRGPRLYWGDVHGHTTFSDGSVDVDTYLRRARHPAGLDFAIVTDHDFGNAAPWRLSREDWGRIQDRVDAHYRPGEFVAIAGFEWTSQPKYWRGYRRPGPGERRFAGPVRYFGHKNVYFPHRVPDVFPAKDAAFRTPDLLARAVASHGGLVHTCHPGSGTDDRDQWVYGAAAAVTIVNTEIMPDTIRHGGRVHTVGAERAVRAFLDAGGRVGFVGGSDSHDGRPVGRTAVYAEALTRPALFAALRRRHCYAVYGARIQLGFWVDGVPMGGEVRGRRAPILRVAVAAPAPIAEVLVVRDGVALRTFAPGTRVFEHAFADTVPGTSKACSYYYVRVRLADADAAGNPSYAWASPVWVAR